MRKDYWRHNWKTAAWATLGVLFVAETTILLVYPMEDWLWELFITGTLCIVITMPLIVHFAGQSRDNKELAKELERLVNHDRLTNLATRHRFYEQVADHLGHYGTVLMMDLDYFKRINDNHGHLVGDQVLRDVAALLMADCRNGDIVCRFGGEEILVFLRDSDADYGMRMAESLRAAVEGLNITVEGAVLRVTISIGVAQKQISDSIDSVIADADKALYAAKGKGRNCVVAIWELPNGESRALM